MRRIYPESFFDQLRSLIVGKAYTSADLAFYNKGNQLPSLITTNISTSIMSVLFPAIANISDEKTRVKEMTRKAVKIMSFVMFPMLFGLGSGIRSADQCLVYIKMGVSCTLCANIKYFVSDFFDWRC